MTAVERFQEGQLVGRYRIIQLIGEGGMGAVYEAVHPGLKKRVAIKVLLPRIAERHDARVRFLREGEAASRINHPNVVSVFDVGEDNDVPYLVMEFLEGRTLDDLLARRGALELSGAAALFLPIMAAVAAGHDCGVVHRDLKPQNIFLAQGRRGDPIPKVLDFGVSKLIDHDGPPVTRTDTMLGTACYMSPEQARGARNVDARSDQFTLGLILYEMLTGRRAYRGENDLEILYSAASATVQPAQELRSGLPEQVYALLSRMLAVAPADRYPNLRDAAQVLLPFAGEKLRTALGGDFDPLAPAVPEAEAEAPPQSAGTAVFPVIPPRAEDSTLRHAAIQSKRPQPAPGRPTGPRTKVAAAVGVATVAVGVALAWRAGQTGVRPAPTARSLPSAPATRSLPSAPAARPLANDTPGPVVQPAPAAPAVAPSPPLEPAASSDTPADRSAPFEISAFPPEAQLVLDGRQAVTGHLQLVLPLAGSSHELRVSAPGYQSKTVSFDAARPPPEEIRLDRAAAAAPPAAANKAANNAANKAANKAAHGTQRPGVKRGTNDALIIK